MAQDPLSPWTKIIETLGRGLRNQYLIFALLFMIVGLLFVTRTDTVPPQFINLAYFVVVGPFGIALVTVIASVLLKARPTAPSSSSIAPPPREKEPERLSTGDKSRASLSESEQLQAYLSKVIDESKVLRLGGLSSEASDPQKSAAEQRNPLLLTDVFISLKIDRYRGEPEEQGRELREHRELKEREQLTALEALSADNAPRAALLGQPGAGKSSILRYLTYSLAQAYPKPKTLQTNLPEWKAEALLPVSLSLAKLADALPERVERGLDGRVKAFIQAEVEAHEDLHGFGEHFWREVKERGAIFLFDGLDEVAPLKRAVVKQAIVDFLATRSNCRAIVTCRTYSYGDPDWRLEGWPAYTLEPLSTEQQKEFIGKWYDTLIRSEPQAKSLYDEKTQRLEQAILSGDARQLHQIAGNPLLLTLIVIVHTHRDELPRSRVRIYDEGVELLLIRWQTRRQKGAQLLSVLEAMTKAAPDEKKSSLENLLMRGLYEVAFHARDGRGLWQGETTLIDKSALEVALLPKLGEAATKVFVEYCETANGLLLAQGLRRLPDRPADEPQVMCFSFPHPSFEEYLAARYIATLPQPHLSLAGKNAESDRWFYVGLFLSEYNCIVQKESQKMLSLVDELLSERVAKRGASDGYWRNVWLAGVIWPIFRREFPDQTETAVARDLETRARVQLATLYAEGHLSPRERADAGRALAVLGDPRDFDELVTIPAGSFWMGSEKHTDECPLHQVFLYEYKIGKYPVTVGQWKRFVEAKKYECNPNSLRGYDNHPVTDISWQETHAYCDWITGVWRSIGRIGHREVVRLPTEAEWEKAACGGDKREWPWGNKFDSNKANTHESGIWRTCAVGSLLESETPYGILDMAGNVWEWTLSEYRGYPYISTDGREDIRDTRSLRVMRGGACIGNADLARCASRERGLPDSRGGYIGFRIVVSSSIP